MQNYLTLLLSWLIYQASFQFDYRLVYQMSYPDDRPKRITYDYVNSRDNSYIAKIDDADKGQQNLHFLEHSKMFCWVKGKIDPERPGKILVKDSLTHNWKGPSKKTASSYFFRNLTDTIIGTQTFSRVELRLKNEKKARRKKIVTTVYVLEKSAAFKPSFDPVAYKLWKDSGEPFSGIIHERICYDPQGKFLHKRTLTDVQKTDLFLMFGK